MPYSTVIDGIASALVTKINGLQAAYSLDQNVIGYKWPKVDFDAPRPVGNVELPELRRRGPTERESQLGSNDWQHEFPVTFWIDNTGANTNFPLLIDIVEAWIKAIDADPALGLGTVIPDETSVIECVPVVIDSESTRLVGYETRVALTRLVAS